MAEGSKGITLHSGERKLEQSTSDYYHVLGKTGNILSVLPDFDTAWKTITEYLGQAIAWERAEVMIFLSELDSFELYALQTTYPSILLNRDTLIPRKGSACGWVYDNRDISVRCNIYHDQQFIEDSSYAKEGLKRLINIPLLVRDSCLGTLNIGTFESDYPKAGDLDFLRQLSFQLAMAIDNVLAHEQISRLRSKRAIETQQIQPNENGRRAPGRMIGSSKALKKVLNLAESVAPTDTTVLLTGETGTGKELLAQYIHDLSSRKTGPFVRVNCAGLPAGLVESELFGHERGAFTGADHRKQGKFELAHKGTLFLDEIGELPPEAQAKLLRVLQDGLVDRVGGKELIPVDVRIIAATNSDLRESINTLRFRPDLYFRLHVFPITLPPLRDRISDIPLLANFFLEYYCSKFQRTCQQIAPESLERLFQYSWPGNIRELQNVIERATILSNREFLHIDDILFSSPQESQPEVSGHNLKDLEKKKILEALEKTDWQIDGNQGAAKLLGLHHSTLRSRLKKLGIQRPRPALKNTEKALTVIPSCLTDWMWNFEPAIPYLDYFFFTLQV